MFSIIITILMAWAGIGFFISYCDRDNNLPHWLWLILSGPVIWIIYLILLFGYVVDKCLGRS